MYKPRTASLKPNSLNVALLGGLLAFGGCTSTSTIDTAFSDVAQPTQPAPLPAPAEPAVATAPTTIAPVALEGPRDTGAFPNINDEPVPTLSAGTDNSALLAEMQALAAAQASGSISPAAYQARVAELQRLAATHSTETLRRIEGQ